MCQGSSVLIRVPFLRDNMSPDRDKLSHRKRDSNQDAAPSLFRTKIRYAECVFPDRVGTSWSAGTLYERSSSSSELEQSFCSHYQILFLSKKSEKACEKRSFTLRETKPERKDQEGSFCSFWRRGIWSYAK
jgi:hypothetical protein